MRRVIHTDEAPKAVGPYSQAVEIHGALYISGQLPIHPQTGDMPRTIEEQTRQALENVGAILKAAGYRFEEVVKSPDLLADMKDFAAMNRIYAEYYESMLPARVCYQVAALPMGAKVEIETVAMK